MADPLDRAEFARWLAEDYKRDLWLLEDGSGPSSRDRRADVAELLAAATAPQEHVLVASFLDEGCSTIRDVERLNNWPRGHGYKLAKRLREKVRRRRAA